MGKIELLLFILLIFSLSPFVAAPLEARQRGVQVRLSGQELFETEPKNVVTTTFEVTNTSDEELEFVSHVKLPKAWKLIIPSFPFRLAPNGTEIRLVSFFIPQTALAGRYEITYLIRSNRYPSISDSVRVFVVVLSVTKLQAKLLQAPEYVIAGDDYEARFSVINESNTENIVIIKVHSGQDLPYTVEPEKLKLAPGESRTVKVVVKTDEKTRKGFKHHLRFTVQSLEDEKLRGQARCAVSIIPKITGEVDRYHRIPAEITFRSAGERDEEKKTGFQGEFSGRGPLDEEGDKEIEFLFRGPDTLEDCSTFGEHDRYRAGYRSKRYGLRLGDYYYSLSRLTEQTLDGRGVEGKLNLSNSGFGGYHIKTRWHHPEEKETAIHFDYLFRDRYRIGLNLLKKKVISKTVKLRVCKGNLSLLKIRTLNLKRHTGRMTTGMMTAHTGSIFTVPATG